MEAVFFLIFIYLLNKPQLQVSLPTAKATQLLPLSAEDPAQSPTGVIPGVAVVGAHVVDLMPCRGRQLPWFPALQSQMQVLSSIPRAVQLSAAIPLHKEKAGHISTFSAYMV